MIDENNFVEGANSIFTALSEALRKAIIDLPSHDKKYIYMAVNSAIGNFMASFADTLIKEVNYEIKIQAIDNLAAFAKQRLKEVLIEGKGH